MDAVAAVVFRVSCRDVRGEASVVPRRDSVVLEDVDKRFDITEA
jgi:hypothetical protein